MAENTESENKPKNSSVKKKKMSFALSAVIVGIGLIFTKGSGLIRDVLVSVRFSEDIYRDAYMLAFNVPDLFYNLLVGGAIYSTIAPYMSAQLSVGKEREGARTVSKFITLVTLVMVVVCTFGTIFSVPLYNLYAVFQDVKNPETVYLAARASKVLFPQVFFIMLAALCNGILISYRRFTITSFAPVLYNILVIVSVLLLGGNSLFNLTLTMGGLLVAALLNFLFQYTLGFKQLKQFRLNFHFADKEFLHLFFRAIPILISASVVQINAIVLNSFALQFDEGSVYLFRNASTIWQIPYSIFVVAVTTVMTPELSGDYKNKNFNKASELVSHSMKSSLFMTIPSAAFIAVMNVDVVKAVYQWHPYYTNENAATAAVFLLGFCSSIITATVVHVFNQAFYAIGKTKLPLFAGIIGLVVNPVICKLLIAVGGGLLSLSLAYSVTSVIQMVMLSIMYCRQKQLAPHGIFRFLLRSGLCAAVMAVVVFFLDRLVPAYGGKIVQLCIISVKGIVAVIVYFVMAALLRMEEATEWIDKFKTKFLKKFAAKKA